MFKAKDVMITKVICIRPEMPIYEAIRLMTRSNLSALPVVDKDLKLQGILSEKDVLRLLYDTKDSPNLKVEDFMRPSVISFDFNHSLIELCDCFLSNNFRRIPITQNEMLFGMITPTDIIEAILELKHQHNKSKKVS